MIQGAKGLRVQRRSAEVTEGLFICVFLLAWSAVACAFEPAPWTYSAELATEKTDGTFPDAASLRLSQGHTSSVVEESSSNRDETGEFRQVRKHIKHGPAHDPFTIPLTLPHWLPRRPANVPGKVANFALLSWGPGWLYYVTIPPKWIGPNCLMTHYTRRFRSNVSQDQIVWMRDAHSCLNGFMQWKFIHYPGMPCPRFLEENIMCHLIGDHIAIQPWEKWADYNVYVDLMDTPFLDWGAQNIPYILPYGRKIFNMRLHTCDPTRNCMPFPKKTDKNIGMDLRTTGGLSRTHATHRTTTTTPSTTIFPPWVRRKRRKVKCPGACRARKIAEILWPVFFITTLIMLFGIFPLVYFCAKKRTERNRMKRWYRASSQDEHINFLMRVPPRWAPGWPPGPSTGEPSRTNPDGKWRKPNSPGMENRSGPPPTKRRKRS